MLPTLLLPSSSFLILIPLVSLVTLLLTVMTWMVMVVLDFPLRQLSLLPVASCPLGIPATQLLF